MTHNYDTPVLVEGGVAVDDRGQLTFVNGFDMTGIKRFYMVSNHDAGTVRAWHGHQKEAKYFFVASGALLVGVVKIDDWSNPSAELPVSRYVLSAAKPSILRIPAGTAHGHMSLTQDMRLIVLSTTTLEESLGDDFRYDARQWDCWHVIER